VIDGKEKNQYGVKDVVVDNPLRVCRDRTWQTTRVIIYPGIFADSGNPERDNLLCIDDKPWEIGDMR